jgi:hypothetical protein
MISIAVAACAVTTYWLWLHANHSMLVSLGVIAAIAICACVGLGWKKGHAWPKASRWLLSTWTTGVVGVGGVGAAIAANYTTLAVAEKEAASSTKTTFALITAAIAAIAATLVKEGLPKHLSPWLARRLLCKRYQTKYFNCRPVGPGMDLGRNAWEQLSAARSDDSKWKGANLQTLLTTVNEAITAGQHKGATGWKCP